jgi:Skp family chaperone for outer membrane proteins
MSDSQGRGRWPIIEWVYVAGLAILLVYAIFFMNPHRVGVLDVARVARETGVLDRMQREERGLQDEARERLGKLQQAHVQKVNDLTRKLKSAGSESEKSRIQGEIDSLQEAFQQSVAAARQNLQRHEAQMFATFRKRLMPHVEKVARKRRLDIVLDPATTVLITKKTPDITEAVVAEVRDVFLPTQPLIDLSLIETRPAPGKWVGAAAADQSEEPLAAPVQPEKTR